MSNFVDMKQAASVFSLSIDSLRTLQNAIPVGEQAVVIDNTFTPFVTAMTDEWRNCPVQLDEIVVIFCTEGSIDVRIAFQNCTITENMVAVLPPGTIVEILNKGDNFHGMTLAFSKDFMDLEQSLTMQLMQLFKYIQKKPVTLLSGAYATRYRETFAETVKTAAWTDNPLRPNMIQSYIYILFCCLYPVLSKGVSKPEEDINVTTQKAIYFKFMEYLQAGYREHRTVAYYADLLGLTPKYLSKVIQTESGQSALRWIENYVLLEAKALLNQPKSNVKSVSDKLNFPNQGSFGKFFHRLTGVSPKEYKDKK